MKVGDRIEIVHTIPRRADAWETSVVGTVVAIEEKPTGSWYAHGRDGKLWLGRVQLRKDDGEETLVTIDENTRFRVLQATKST